MFENRSQRSKTEVNARTERSQNSSHEQSCFLLKKKRVESQYASSSRNKDTHVYNNCYELRSRAIKKSRMRILIRIGILSWNSLFLQSPLCVSEWANCC